MASNSGSDKVYTGKEAKIKAELDQTGRELAGRAGRTLMPSKSKPNVVKAGKKNYLAKYLTVDQNSVTTSLRPGTTASTPYVGVIQYDEVTMEVKDYRMGEQLGVLLVYELPDTIKMKETEAQSYVAVMDLVMQLQEELPKSIVYYGQERL